jgi:hypothetical protein
LRIDDWGERKKADQIPVAMATSQYFFRAGSYALIEILVLSKSELLLLAQYNAAAPQPSRLIASGYCTTSVTEADIVDCEDVVVVDVLAPPPQPVIVMVPANTTRTRQPANHSPRVLSFFLRK